MEDHGPADDAGEQDGSGCGSVKQLSSEEWYSPMWRDEVVEDLADDVEAEIEERAGQIDPSYIDRDESDAITMSVTVDVRDLDERNRRILRELAAIFEENFREVVNKNRDYDFSFLRTGSKLAATDATPFETAVRSQVYGLLTRSGDKRERVIENVFGDGAAEVSDSPATTARECANYWLFVSLVLSNPELADSFLEVDSTPPHGESSSR